MAKDDPYFRLRLPEELKKMIEAQAQSNHRSATAEIISRLEASFGSSPKERTLREEIEAVVEEIIQKQNITIRKS